MKTFFHSITTWLLFVVVTSCTNTPTQTIQPTQVAIPADLVFATPLVRTLSKSGLSVLSIQSSTYMALFPSTDKAVWIKTDEGIVEAIFFADSAEVEQIHVAEQVNEVEGRYLYTIQAPPPTLLHNQIIDAAFPLYFTAKQDMLMVTSNAELDETLKRIFLEQ